MSLNTDAFGMTLTAALFHETFEKEKKTLFGDTRGDIEGGLREDAVEESGELVNVIFCVENF